MVSIDKNHALHHQDIFTDARYFQRATVRSPTSQAQRYTVSCHARLNHNDTDCWKSNFYKNVIFRLQKCCGIELSEILIQKLFYSQFNKLS